MSTDIQSDKGLAEEKEEGRKRSEEHVLIRGEREIKEISLNKSLDGKKRKKKKKDETSFPVLTFELNFNGQTRLDLFSKS